MKILVTGGSGFIGSALIRFLISETNASVVNVDALTYAAVPGALDVVETDSRYKFEKVNICDGISLGAVFAKHSPDTVIHLAAESHVDRSIDNPAAFVETNVLGTCRLLEVALLYWRSLESNSREKFKFHHVSTDEVYGSLDAYGAFTENSSYNPNSPYSASKASSDHFVRAWNTTYGLPVTISNCSNNYGIYQFPEKLIPLMIINGILWKPLPIYGKGENIRDWLFVEDHARAIWSIINQGNIGETYNVGGGAEMSNLTVVSMICDILDDILPDPKNHSRRELITFVKDRPGHDFRYAIDSTKICGQTDWLAQESFQTGLRKTVSWFIENKKWWQLVQEGTYDGGRLGLGPKTKVN